MARRKQTARTSTKKSKQKGRGKKENKDVDENQVAVEAAQPPSKRAKVDDTEKSVGNVSKAADLWDCR